MDRVAGADAGAGQGPVDTEAGQAVLGDGPPPVVVRRSLGRFAILDHVRQAGIVGLPFVYLGYWVRGSRKMDYKAEFRPAEVLRFNGWEPLE